MEWGGGWVIGLAEAGSLWPTAAPARLHLPWPGNMQHSADSSWYQSVPFFVWPVIAGGWCPTAGPRAVLKNRPPPRAPSAQPPPPPPDPSFDIGRPTSPAPEAWTCPWERESCGACGTGGAQFG